MPYFRKLLLIGLVVLLILLFSSNSFNLQAAPTKQVLLLDIPRLTFNDLINTRNFPQIARTGAAGLMTLPNPDPLSLDKVYLSLNSGYYLKTVEESGYLFDTQELYQEFPAGQLYRSLTGYQPKSSGGVYLGLPKLLTISGNKTAGENLGLLGKILHDNSVHTAAIGNADSDEINRSGAALLVDNHGLIDFTSVGSQTLSRDVTFPFGKRSNLDRIYQDWNRFKSQAGVVQITLGDLERIEKYSPFLSDQQYEINRKQVIAEYDRFLARLMATIDRQSTMVILYSSIGPEKKEMLGKRLTPVLIMAPDIRSGLLFSQSTRKSGIITGYDLIASLFKHLEITDRSGYYKGRSLTAKPGDWQTVVNWQPELIWNYNVRWPLLTGYGYCLIGLVLLFGWAFIFWRDQQPIFRWMVNFYLFLLTVPAVFLVEALFKPASWTAIIGYTLFLSGIFFGLVYWLGRRDPFRMLSGICLGTILVILVDGFFNGSQEMFSFLGYSVVAGARFYGIGNEYMGFLVGAVLVFGALNLGRRANLKPIVLWSITVGLAVFLAHPNFGANIGGGITTLIGVGLTTFLWMGRPIRIKELFSLAGTLLVLLLITAVWDFALNGRLMTHFGQFIILIKQEGFKAIGEVINRKMQMNLSIIGYTPWTKILLALIFLIPLIYKKPPAKIAALFNKYPYRLQGFLGLILSAIIALVVNDSGIVAVATMFIFGIILCFLVILKETGHLKELGE